MRRKSKGDGHPGGLNLAQRLVEGEGKKLKEPVTILYLARLVLVAKANDIFIRIARHKSAQLIICNV